MRMYAVVSGLIFAFVSLGHLLRLVFAWPITLGPYTVPLWLSWIGMFVTAALVVWAGMAFVKTKAPG
jgi:hypothetical protein